MTQEAGTLQTRGGTRIYRGTFGQYEELELRLSRRGDTIKVRATGQYQVAQEIDYKRVPVEITETVHREGTGVLEDLVVGIMLGEEGAAEEVLALMTAWALEEAGY